MGTEVTASVTPAIGSATVSVIGSLGCETEGLEIIVLSMMFVVDVTVSVIGSLDCIIEGLEVTEVSITSAIDILVSVNASLSCTMGRDATEVSMALFSPDTPAKIYIYNKQN